VLDKLAACETMFILKDETSYGSRGEAIANEVVVGNNIVIPCESGNGEQFWLLLCDEIKHIMIETVIDTYKNTYYEGDELIHGC
jgi:hypothetical protein